MKHKPILISLTILLIASEAFAEELPNPGILPDHPFYPFKRLFESLRLWLTFDEEARARLHAFIAEQRLAELKAMIEKGKFEYVERLKDDYEKEMENLEGETNRIYGRAMTIGFGRNVALLTEHTCNVTYKHIKVLQNILERAPEQAREGLERAINASIKGHLKCIERIGGILDDTEKRIRKFNCTRDEDCVNLGLRCPEIFYRIGEGSFFRVGCFIPPNRTEGFCRCLPRERLNCNTDFDCRDLICPMILGMAPICWNNKCRCGPPWEFNITKRWGEGLEDIVLQNLRERGRFRTETIRIPY